MRGLRKRGFDSANGVHLILAPADVAWKSCALRIVFCDPRWVPQPNAVVTLGAPGICRPHASVLAATSSENELRPLSRHVERRQPPNPFALRTAGSLSAATRCG